MQGWVNLVGWLHTDMAYPPADGTYPSTNRVRRWVTLLIHQLYQPLCHAANLRLLRPIRRDVGISRHLWIQLDISHSKGITGRWWLCQWAAEYGGRCTSYKGCDHPADSSHDRRRRKIAPTHSPVYMHTGCIHKNAKWCYVGLAAAGVQEQAEDILVPPLLRKCLTLNYISFS